MMPRARKAAIYLIPVAMIVLFPLVLTGPDFEVWRYGANVVSFFMGYAINGALTKAGL